MTTAYDFVRETTATATNGELTLVAIDKFAELANVAANGIQVDYAIEDSNGNRETGLGTVGALKTLSRDTIYSTYINATGTYDDSSPVAITLSGDSIVFFGATATSYNRKLEEVVSNSDHFSGLGTAASPLTHSQAMQDILDITVGVTLDNVAGTITESGGIITATVEKVGTGDVRYKVVGGIQTLDCTPAASVTLTAGTDVLPQLNYMYIDTTTNLMANSTTGWPSSGTYIPLAISLLGSASLIALDGTYMTHLWSDHLRAENGNGHISHINEWIRNQYATYKSGLTFSTSAVPSATVTAAITSGVMYQLHDQTCEAILTPAPFYITNDETAKYTKSTNLADITTDSTGSSVNNKYFSLVVYYAFSTIPGDSKLYVNKPSGSYNSAADARADAEKFTNFSIDTAFKGTAVLIKRLVCRNSGGTLTIYDGAGDDLRGTQPNTASGSSTAVSSSFIDSTFRVENLADITKQIAFNAALITTGTTRTITMPDADVDLGDMPVSAIQQTALDGKVDDSQVLTDVPAGAVFTDTETTTTLSVNTNILSYVDELGATTNIDLSLYLDDTNLAYIQSGSLNGATGIATFTRSDATSFTVDLSALLDDTSVTVENVLTSTSTVNALSAAQGKALKDTADTLATAVGLNTTHKDSTHAPTNADNTAANETSHTDVLVDGDVGTTANKLVQLDANAKLPVVDGSQLTNLPSGGGIGEFIDTSIAISSDDSALALDDGGAGDNVGIGLSALSVVVTGTSNTAVGSYTLTENTGHYNVGIGHGAGRRIRAANGNIGVGYNSIHGDATAGLSGSYNVGVGYQAGTALTTGQYNFLGGYQAGYKLTTGSNNVLIGRSSGDAVTTGEDTVAIGYLAASAISTASGNVCVGARAGQSSSGANNTFIGKYAGQASSAAASNVCIGYYAGYVETASNKLHIANNSAESLIEGDFVAKTLSLNAAVTATSFTGDGSGLTGLSSGGIGEFKGSSVGISDNGLALNGDDSSDNDCVAIGDTALYTNISGINNIAIGVSALLSTTGSGNIGVGKAAARDTTGSNNTAIGTDAGQVISTGSYNIALGALAMGSVTKSITGSHNTAIGYNAGNVLTTGQYNVLNGYQAGFSLTTGQYNVLNGYQAGYSLTTQGDNTAIGRNALKNSVGLDNTSVGSGAGYGITSGTGNLALGRSAMFGTQGSDNVAIGAGSLTSGSGNSNVCIGHDAGTTASGNELHIANNATESLIEGDFSAKTLHINGAVSATSGLGSLELIETYTIPSSIASMDFNATVIGYDRYELHLDNVKSVGGVNGWLSIRFGVSGVYETTNYLPANNSMEMIPVAYGFASSTHILSGFNALAPTLLSNTYQVLNNGLTTESGGISGSVHTASTALDSIQITSYTSNMLSGTISLYGVKS